MATVSQVLDPTCGVFRTSGFPAIVQANGTTIPIRGLAFDAAAEEAVFFELRAVKYGSGNLTVDIDWYADTASSGVCIWGAQLAAITPGDTQDVEADSLATAATTNTTHPGGTVQRLQRTTVTITSLDSLAADDVVLLRVYRDADAAGDTMTGDAIMIGLTVSYSDT